MAGWMSGVLTFLHEDVIVAAHSSYPLTLMFGYTLFGNVLLRKECDGEPYPSWLLGFVMGFLAYGYPGWIISDLLFGHAPQALSNESILAMWALNFFLIQSCRTLYKVLCWPRVFILLSTWWLADTTRASLCYLERTATQPSVLTRGVWQAAIWWAAGPLARVLEMRLRGVQVPPLHKLQPNSINVFRYPLVAGFAAMIFYLVYLTYLADCRVLATSGSESMSECGQRHHDVYASLVYICSFMHLLRNVWTLAGLTRRSPKSTKKSL